MLSTAGDIVTSALSVFPTKLIIGTVIRTFDTKEAVATVLAGSFYPSQVSHALGLRQVRLKPNRCLGDIVPKEA